MEIVIVLLVLAAFLIWRAYRLLVKLSEWAQYAVLECHALMSFEWQFEEEVVETVQKARCKYIRLLSKSKTERTIFRLCFGVLTQAEVERRMIKMILAHAYGQDACDIRIGSMTRDELTLWWKGHVAPLADYHQDRFIKFHSVEFCIETEEEYGKNKAVPYIEYYKQMASRYQDEAIRVVLVRKKPISRPRPPEEDERTIEAEFLQPSYI